MANELRYYFGYEFDHVGGVTKLHIGTVNQDVAGTKAIASEMEISASEVVVPVGPVTSPGYVFIANPKTSVGTIRIVVGQGGTEIISLAPGQMAWFPKTSAWAMYAKTTESGEVATLLYHLLPA